MRWLAAVLLSLTTVAAAPQRIVSTAPSITEILFALGLGDRVVGVSNYCHYPAEAKQRPKVGSYLKPSIETILSLRPDLVIIQRNPSGLAGQLTGAKLNVLEVEHDSVSAIYQAIEKIGAAAGAPERAGAEVRRIQQRLAAIQARLRGQPARSLLFVVGRTPGTLEGIIAVGRSSYLNEVMEIAGGRNVLRDAAAPYPKVALEEILSRNPDLIVDMGEMAETIGVTERQKQTVVQLWARYPMLAAVRQGNVSAVASDIFVVPGPRVVDAALAFARMLHPGVTF